MVVPQEELGQRIENALRLVIDPDDAREKAYLAALGTKLQLPPPLLAHLESQAALALPAPGAEARVSA